MTSWPAAHKAGKRKQGVPGKSRPAPLNPHAAHTNKLGDSIMTGHKVEDAISGEDASARQWSDVGKQPDAPEYPEGLQTQALLIAAALAHEGYIPFSLTYSDAESLLIVARIIASVLYDMKPRPGLIHKELPFAW